MNIQEVISNPNMNFTGIESSYFLLGLLSAFDNRFQAFADKEIGEISWKQFFAIICINMCKQEPTIKELADIMGSSHQNVKQILLKLESKGFVQIKSDTQDKRKQRVCITDKCRDFCACNDDKSIRVMTGMFEGISEEELRATIGTIIKMEGNLKNISKGE